MPILNKMRNPPGDPADVIVPRIYDDPDYARAAELLSAFRHRLDRIEREQERLRLERALAAGERSNEEHLRWRLKTLQALPPLAPAAPTASTAPTPAIARGLAVLAGAPVEPATSYQAQMLDLDRNSDALGAAIREQQDIVDVIAGELTVKFATQLRPAWNALQLEMYRAAQELARSTRRVRELRAAITAAGIGSRSDILAMPNVRAPLILGEESDFSSEIRGWGRILEQLGIL